MPLSPVVLRYWTILIAILLPAFPVAAVEFQATNVFKALSDAGGWSAARNPRLLGDVNGDGRADIVGFGDDGVWLALRNNAGFDTPRLVLKAYGYNAGNWRIERHPRLLGDVNGDNRADIVGFGNAGVYVSVSTGAGFAAPVSVSTTFDYDSRWRVDRHPRVLADVNGDKLNDIVGFANAGTYVAFNTGKGFAKAVQATIDFAYEKGWRVTRHPRFLADVNGDGMDDVVGFANAGTYLALSTGKAFAPAQRVIDTFGYEAGDWRVELHPRFLADVDGDRRADVVGFGNAGVYLSLSTGTGFTPPRQVIDNYGYKAGGWQVDRNPRALADVNGDGQADIVGFGNAAVFVSISTGTGFGAPEAVVQSMVYDQGWRVPDHPRLIADVTGDGRADVVGFGPVATGQILAREDSRTVVDTTTDSSTTLSLPPSVTSALPSRGIQIEQGGNPVTVRAEGLNLAGVSARILYRNAPADAVSARVVASAPDRVDIELRAAAQAPTGNDYALVVRNASGAVDNVPVGLEVVAQSPFKSVGDLGAPTTTSPAVTLPPITAWTKPDGAASGSTLEFSSSTGFDAPGLPSVSKLELRLGDTPLIILDRQPGLVRAKIPYAPLPQSRVNLPLTAAYAGVDNSTRVLDPFFRLDPSFYDPQQAKVVAVRTPFNGVRLDALPFSTQFTLEFTIADFPFPQVRLSNIRLQGFTYEPDDCLTQLHTVAFARVDSAFDRQPDGTVRVLVPVFSLGSCRSIPADRNLLQIRDVPISQYVLAEGRREGPTDTIFANNVDSVNLTTRTPRTFTVQSTWALRDALQPVIASQFGTCSGKVKGQPVGVHEFGGDLAISIRSGFAGTECTFFTHRIRAGEGLRFGTIGRIPIAQGAVTQRAVTIEEVLGGDSCDTPTEGTTSTGGLLSFEFNRTAPDQLPPQRIEDVFGVDGRDLRLHDEFPVLPVKLRCKGPVEGGSNSPSDFKLFRIDTITFSADPELDVDESNIANFVDRVCFATKTCVNGLAPFEETTGL